MKCFFLDPCRASGYFMDFEHQIMKITLEHTEIHLKILKLHMLKILQVLDIDAP